MANFYADEQFPKNATIALRALGHDVLTVQDAGNANQKIPDEDVLAFATVNDRAVITINRVDFIRLHSDSVLSGCPSKRTRTRFTGRNKSSSATASASVWGAVVRVASPPENR
jgi:predicted nuclease of predicted toxin-antitoxin system